MKVELIKKAVYELDDSKCTSIPYDVFTSISSFMESDGEKEDLPRVQCFSNVQEFKDNFVPDECDIKKGVRVMKNGTIFIFLKGDNTTVEQKDTPTPKPEALKAVPKTVKADVTADTKEDTGKES